MANRGLGLVRWFLCVQAVFAQFGGGMDQMPKKPKPAPLKEDLKYIQCETCKAMVLEATRQAAELSSNSAVEEMLDKICDADLDGKEGRTKEGAWMSQIDVAKATSGPYAGRAIKLEHKGPGYCRRECRTVAKACDMVMDKLEADELARDVLAAASSSEKPQSAAAAVAQRVCTKQIGVCKKGKVPLWPEGKVRKNEQFKARDKKDEDLENLLSSLKGSGGGGMTMMRPGEMDLGDDKVDEIDVLKDEL